MRSSQPSCSASWNRWAAVRSSSGPRRLSEGVQHRGDGGGAIVGQVARIRPASSIVVSRTRSGSPNPFPCEVILRVGLLGAPGLIGGLGDQLQVVQVSPGGGGLDEDLVGFLMRSSSWS